MEIKLLKSAVPYLIRLLELIATTNLALKISIKNNRFYLCLLFGTGKNFI